MGFAPFPRSGRTGSSRSCAPRSRRARSASRTRGRVRRGGRESGRSSRRRRRGGAARGRARAPRRSLGRVARSRRRSKLRGEREWGEARGVQDLVRPGTPDAGDGALVAEQRVEAPRGGRENLGEPLGADPERLRAQVRKLFVGLLWCEQPDTGALLRARLGEHELAAALEAESEGGRLRAFRAGAEVAQAARGHEVDHQHELAVLGLEQEPLAAPGGAGQASALERLQRRVDRLQRGDVGRPGALDRKRAHGIVERLANRFDLGQFRHGPSVRRTMPPAETRSPPWGGSHP